MGGMRAAPAALISFVIVVLAGSALVNVAEAPTAYLGTAATDDAAHDALMMTMEMVPLVMMVIVFGALMGVMVSFLEAAPRRERRAPDPPTQEERLEAALEDVREDYAKGRIGDERMENRVEGLLRQKET